MFLSQLEQSSYPSARRLAPIALRLVPSSSANHRPPRCSLPALGDEISHSSLCRLTCSNDRPGETAAVPGASRALLVSGAINSCAAQWSARIQCQPRDKPAGPGVARKPLQQTVALLLNGPPPQSWLIDRILGIGSRFSCSCARDSWAQGKVFWPPPEASEAGAINKLAHLVRATHK